MSAALHSGLYVAITNPLAAVVSSCYSGGNIVIGVLISIIIIFFSVRQHEACRLKIKLNCLPIIIIIIFLLLFYYY